MAVRELVIYQLGVNPIVTFASRELASYLKQMSAGLTIDVQHREQYDSLLEPGIWLGLMSEIGLGQEQKQKSDSGNLSPSDDAIHIDVADGKGFISGTNFRSILIGCYRFLTEAGCRWVRPGKDGEYIPSAAIMDLKVRVVETPTYRHRGVCIEGAVSYDHVLQMIDWLPKVGMNSYFIQFREAYTFFERWYKHENNPLLPPEPFSAEDARDLVSRLEIEIAQRGLSYHKVGHGWTSEPFGLDCQGWYPGEYELDPKIVPYLAVVQGKRQLWGGAPINTNLCYSNKDARTIVIQDITKYLTYNPGIDLLHVWLADHANNHCECDNCQKRIPSDFYVQMLNELDEDLTAAGIETRIVFLVYLDLLWAPQIEKIRNPDRFVMMFAPITRTYSRPYTSETEHVKLPEYKRNQLVISSSVDVAIGFLQSWQYIFEGDSFSFDYHFMWDHYFDPGYIQVAERLHEDIRNLKQIGLNGLISCQTQRAFYPTGLCMYVMGMTLWNDQLPLKDIVDDYFRNAFGEEGYLCSDYLSLLSRLFNPPYLRGEEESVNAEQADIYKQIPQLITQFEPVILRNLQNGHTCHAQSWRYLQLHSTIAICLASMVEARASGDEASCRLHWEKLKVYVQEKETELQYVFDVYEFIFTYESRFFKEE